MAMQVRIVMMAMMVSTVKAVSNGALGSCLDISLDMPLGSPDPQDKKEKNNIMNWVVSPQKSNYYTVSSGDNNNVAPTTTYIPGDLIPIHIRVQDLSRLFIGIFMYAVDADDQRVGGWEIPPGAPYQVVSACAGRALVHRDAEPKPVHTMHYFRAPASGTGSITFKVLIKQGEQAKGNFFLPRVELSLEEAATPSAVVLNARPIKGKAFQSCNDVCAEKQMACDETATRTLNTEDTLFNAVSMTTSCHLPFLQGCGPESPATGSGGWCIYNSATCRGQSDLSMCSARGESAEDNQRFCSCKEGTVVVDPEDPTLPKPVTARYLHRPMVLDGVGDIVLNSLEMKNGKFTAEVTGPADKWFGVGWDSQFMEGTYATLFSTSDDTSGSTAESDVELLTWTLVGCVDDEKQFVDGTYDVQRTLLLAETNAADLGYDYFAVAGISTDAKISHSFVARGYTGDLSTTCSPYGDIDKKNEAGSGSWAIYTKPKVVTLQPVGPPDIIERKLGNHESGKLLKKSVEVLSAGTMDGKYTVKFTRELEDGMDYHDFSLEKDSMTVIWAMGSSTTFAYHASHSPPSLVTIPLETTPPPYVGDPTANGGSSSNPHNFATLLCMLGGCMMFPSSSRSTFIFVLMAVLVLVLPRHSVEAHNWVNNPSRARIASVSKPCQRRLNPDPHLQIAPNQEFQMEWAVGHGETRTKYTYWVAIRSSDYDELKMVTDTLLEEYINAAPESAKKWEADKYMRRHVGSEEIQDGANYRKEIKQGNALFIQRDPTMVVKSFQDFANPKQWQYNSEQLSNDIRVSYESERYPWIEAVHRLYIGEWHEPKEVDLAIFTMEARSGAGDYIMFYKWGGYTDCVDINVRADTVVNSYGLETIDGSDATWVKIDHCEFTYVHDVRRKTPCTPMGAANSAQECIDACEDDTGCYAVQAVRIENPTYLLEYPERTPYSDWVKDEDRDEFSKGEPTNVCNWHSSIERASRNCDNPAEYCDKDMITSSDSKYVCYGFKPYRNQDRQASEDYEIANDWEDPKFYSTCWTKMNPGGFLDTKKWKQPLPDWRANDGCISCAFQTQVKNIAFDVAPDWETGLVDTCTKCDDPNLG